MSCDKCECKCPLEAGDEIRYKKTFIDTNGQPYRLSGACPMYLTYISKEWVLFSIYGSQDDYIREASITRNDFDLLMEKGRGAVV